MGDTNVAQGGAWVFKVDAGFLYSGAWVRQSNACMPFGDVLVCKEVMGSQ